MPERYGVGPLYQMLRVCERMGLSVASVLPGFDPGKETHRAQLLAYEHVREVEEARERVL